MGAKNQKKPAQAPKRGRGRPSNEEIARKEIMARLTAALDFILSLETEESERWLANLGYCTAAERKAAIAAVAAEKRERLEREIAERQAELASLDTSPVSSQH